MHTNTASHLGPLGPCKCMHKREVQGVTGLHEDKDRAAIFQARSMGAYYIAATLGLAVAGLWELSKDKRSKKK